MKCTRCGREHPALFFVLVDEQPLPETVRLCPDCRSDLRAFLGDPTPYAVWEDLGASLARHARVEQGMVGETVNWHLRRVRSPSVLEGAAT